MLSAEECWGAAEREGGPNERTGAEIVRGSWSGVESGGPMIHQCVTSEFASASGKNAANDAERACHARGLKGNGREIHETPLKQLRRRSPRGGCFRFEGRLCRKGSLSSVGGRWGRISEK